MFESESELQTKRNWPICSGSRVIILIDSSFRRASFDQMRTKRIVFGDCFLTKLDTCSVKGITRFNGFWSSWCLLRDVNSFTT